MKHKYLEIHREEERTGKVDQKSARHCDVPGWAAGPPWPFPLWASIPPFLGITLQAGGAARGSFHPTVGSVGLLKSSLKTFDLSWSQSAAWRWDASSSCQFSWSPQALSSYEEKSSLYNSVAATGQSGSLNEIDERSGSGCYHKVLRNISLKRFAFTFFITFIFLMNFILLITFLTNSSFLNTFNFLIRFTFPITSTDHDYVQYVTVSVVKQVPSYSKHCTKVCLNLVNLADCGWSCVIGRWTTQSAKLCSRIPSQPRWRHRWACFKQ